MSGDTIKFHAKVRDELDDTDKKYLKGYCYKNLHFIPSLNEIIVLYVWTPENNNKIADNIVNILIVNNAVSCRVSVTVTDFKFIITSFSRIIIALMFISVNYSCWNEGN